MGGKIEPGESPQEALRREVEEELGVKVAVGPLLHSQLEKYDHGVFELHYFACVLRDDTEPQALGCSEWMFVSARDLPKYDLLPVDINIAKIIAQYGS